LFKGDGPFNLFAIEKQGGGRSHVALLGGGRFGARLAPVLAGIQTIIKGGFVQPQRRRKGAQRIITECALIFALLVGE